MLKVTKCDDTTFLVYKNSKYIGAIGIENHSNKYLYTAIDKDGHKLGDSTVYGDALALILKVPNGVKYYFAHGDD